jgi:IS1 family transposase
MSTVEGQECLCPNHKGQYIKCSTCLQTIVSSWSYKTDNKAILATLSDTKDEIDQLKTEIQKLEGERKDRRVVQGTQEMPLPVSCPVKNLGSFLQHFLNLILPGSYFEVARHPELSLSFMLKNGLIPTTKPCPACTDSSGTAIDMRLDSNSFSGYCFICPVCETRLSVKHNTIWHKANMSVEKMLLFLLLWTVGLKDTEIARLTDSDLGAVRALSQKFRRLVGWYFLSNLPLFTGVVEIDETNFFRRKIEIGKGKNNERWVVGLYNRETKLTYMELVPKRSAQHLLPIVQSRCEVGTTIITDQWGAYEKLTDLGYPHYTIDHTRHFVHPENREIHTQHVEISWGWAKYDIKRKNRGGGNLQDYLNEFCWRRQYKNRYKNAEVADIMAAIMEILRKNPSGEVPDRPYEDEPELLE